MLQITVIIEKPGQPAKSQPGIYSSTAAAIIAAIDLYGDELIGAKISAVAVPYV